MLAKLIPTRVHGVLDYLTGVIFLVLPRLLGWEQPETWLMSILGVSVIVYSLITRYELGVIKWIPMPVHLILDLLGGLLLIAAPFLFFQNEEPSVRTWYLILGVFELGASLFSDNTPRLETSREPTGATNVYEREGGR
jgi:hypothetical protein